MPVSGSNPAPGQLVPPLVLPMLIAPSSFEFGPTGGTYGICSQRNSLRFSSACARSAGVKSIKSLLGDVRARIRGRLGHKRLRLRGFLTGHVGLRNRPFLDRPDRLTPVMRSNTYSQLCFDGTATTLRGLPSIVTSISERRRRHVVIPHRMMHELEVPFLRAGLQIDRDEALGIEVVARAVAAVFVDGRRLDGQIDDDPLPDPP